MVKLNLEKEDNVELLHRLLIENNNIEKCMNLMAKEGATDDLLELFKAIKETYYAIYDEILRRMNHASEERK